MVSTRGQFLALQDLDLETSITSDDVGLAVRVVHDGCWGFAAGIVLSPEEAARLAERAVEVARASRPVSTERVVLAANPHTRTGSGRPPTRPTRRRAGAEKVATLLDLTERLKAGDGVAPPGTFQAVRENVFYADLAGTSTTQTRVASSPNSRRRRSTAHRLVRDACAPWRPPAAAGWEYVTSADTDLVGEIAEIPELLAAKIKAPSVRAGDYDLVIDGSNLFLTIHESIGHATGSTGSSATKPRTRGPPSRHSTSSAPSSTAPPS